MVFNIQSNEKKIFDLISSTADELGFPAYVVGGYVRDRLLARPSKDMDIVCVGSGIKLALAVANKMRPRARVTTYKRFGTAMLMHEGMEVEFVGARKESYRFDSRKPAIEEGTLDDDQNRRDFTINALAVSLNEADYGSIVDPFHGLEHLEQKLIKTPLEPGRTFSDDPLRMMRGIRFSSQLGFTIEGDTLDAISKFRNRIKIISWERISSELNKILLSSKPSIGLNHLHETGLLELILPELEAMKGIEVKNGISHKDNFYHTLQVVDQLAAKSDNLWLRWSALLHDIAKPVTKRFEKDHGWTFHGHEAVGAAMVPRIFRRLKLPMDHKMKFVQKMVQLHQRPIALTKEDISNTAVRRILFDAGEDIDLLMLLCEADITSKNEKRIKKYLKNYEFLRERIQEVEASDHLRNWQPPISGELIMETFGIPPCRDVGVIKNAIREAILDGDIGNTYDAAFAFMVEQGKKIGLNSEH